MYSTDEVNPAPTSWGAVFDPDSPYKGKVTAYDSPIYIADAALYLMKTKPELRSPTPTPWTTPSSRRRSTCSSSSGDRRVLVGLHQGGPGLQGRRLRARHHLAGDREPGQGGQGPGRGDPAQRGRDRLVGHLDGLVEAEEPQLRLQWLDWIARRRPTPKVAEWFGEAPSSQGRATRPPTQPLRHVPRVRRRLRRADLVLDHARSRSASTAAPTSSARTSRPGPRPGPRSRADAWSTSRLPGSRAAPPAGGVLHRHPRLGSGCCWVRRCCGWSCSTSAPSRRSSSPRSGRSTRSPATSTGPGPSTTSGTCSRPRLPHRPLRTLLIAAAVTVIDALLALPIAFFMAKVASPRLQRALVIAVLTPLWASYLVKAYAWRGMFANGGPLDDLGHLARLRPLATVVTLSYLWLPYMILPMYAGLERLPNSLLEASRRPGRDVPHDHASVVLPADPGGGRRLDLHLLADARRLHHGRRSSAGPTRCSATSSTTRLTGNNLPFAAAIATIPVVVMVVYLGCWSAAPAPWTSCDPHRARARPPRRRGRIRAARHLRAAAGGRGQLVQRRRDVRVASPEDLHAALWWKAGGKPQPGRP